MTSSGRKPARAAAPLAAATQTPPSMRKLRRSAALGSRKLRPRRCEAGVAVGSGSRSPARAVRSSSKAATVTVSVRSAPWRHTRTGTREPGAVPATMRGKSVERSTGLPSKLNTTSPGSMPPRAAGELFSTPRIRAPVARGRRSVSASSRSTASIATPMRPRVTRPVARNWSATSIASSIGMAKEMP